MRFWDEQVLPRLVDASLRGHEIGDLRERTCRGLHGTVLEIGFGSGLNARFYPRAVTRVLAVEPSHTAWRISARRRAAVDAVVERSGLDGEHLHLPSGVADGALVTFSLCTIPDPSQALREVRRVLRPGGRLHFLEHGVSPEPGVQRWQHRLEPLQTRVAGGCHLTRDISRLLAESDFEVEAMEHPPLSPQPLSRPWTYGFLGVARRN